MLSQPNKWKQIVLFVLCLRILKIGSLLGFLLCLWLIKLKPF